MQMQPIVEYQPVDKLVVQSNELVNGKYDFSRDELRIFIYLLLRIKKGDTEFDEVRVPCHILHHGKASTHYHDIKKAADTLTSQKIGVESRDRKGKRKFEFIPLMAICSYREGSGYVTAQFNARMKEHLLGLSKYFTAAQYKLFMEITSFYSYRIYWLLKQYEDFRVRVFDLDELKEKLDIENKYKLYGDFKRRVLNSSKKDLQNSDVAFKFEEIKLSRKVVKIKFIIVGPDKSKPKALLVKKHRSYQPELDFDPKPPEIIEKNKLINTLLYMGFKKPEADQIFDLIEDKKRLKKVLYKFETDSYTKEDLNSSIIRNQFLEIFELEPKGK